jgi:signal peptidase I
MAPTLQGDGGRGSDWVLSENISYWFRPPRRWEVVSFHNVESFLVAKRVVGLPGESISLDARRALINGTPLPVPASLTFLRYYAWGDLDDGKSVNCGEGYFVLGDDSKDSADSRFDGPVSPSEIRARAWLIVWPPSRIGFVNP